MSIATEIATRAESLDRKAARGVFFKLAWMLMKYGGVSDAHAHAEVERCTPRVRDILAKTAVTGSTLSSWAAIADYKNVVEAFQESLASLSVFNAALANGMVKAPLRSRGFSVTTGLTGGTIGESMVKPISSLVLAQQLLEPSHLALSWPLKN